MKTDKFAVIKARAFLYKYLWISRSNVTDGKSALLAASVNKTPTLFVLFRSDLFHFRAAAWARYKWRDDLFGIMISGPFLIGILDNCGHICPLAA
ncbi:MAG: hypothetical protein C3F08_04530 [Candidatus Methylomirabilota bacterium]|nr:MAG: hypothetical protein C3F08_04530 [candidate division NC10 bacterium]